MLKQVTKEQFFDKLNATPADIMPAITNSRWPYTSDWTNQRTRDLFGRSVIIEENGRTRSAYFLRVSVLSDPDTLEVYP